MRIAILDDYQNAALASADWSRLPPGHDITVFTDHIPDRDQAALRERLLPFDIVCIMRERTGLRIGLIEQLPNLKLVAITGMGSSVIDIGLAAKRGVLVCGCDGGGVSTEEHSFGLILALARGIVPAHNSVQAGGWQVGLARELRGATLGIVGLGRLGPTVAGFGNAFGMKVIAWSQNMTTEQASLAGADGPAAGVVAAAVAMVRGGWVGASRAKKCETAPRPGLTPGSAPPPPFPIPPRVTPCASPATSRSVRSCR